MRVDKDFNQKKKCISYIFPDSLLLFFSRKSLLSNSIFWNNSDIKLKTEKHRKEKKKKFNKKINEQQNSKLYLQRMK